MKLHAIGIAACLSLAACGSSDESSPNKDGKQGVDEDAPIDPSKAAALTVRVETHPIMVEPGADSMTCEFMEPLDRDLVVSGFGARQARGGHHMVLFRSITPVEPGTIADCTSADSMANMMPALINMVTPEPGNISMEFPEGMAVVIPKGTQLVTQSHYINTTEDPLAIHDRMDIWLSERDISELTQLHLFIVSASDINIPPATKSHTVKAGCTLERDAQVLSLGAHMHEWGREIALDIGPAGSLRRIVETKDWKAEMRDIAPIISFVENDQPMAAGFFAKGDDAQITCTYTNDDTYPVAFPNEMCAYSGYYVGSDEAASDIYCIEPR